MSEQCGVDGCTDPVENFPEEFPAPPAVARASVSIPAGEDSAMHGLVMCDYHHVAARIMAYTRPDPPYVDVGLYQEVTYYSRALAASAFDLDAMDHVSTGDDA